MWAHLQCLRQASYHYEMVPMTHRNFHKSVLFGFFLLAVQKVTKNLLWCNVESRVCTKTCCWSTGTYCTSLHLCWLLNTLYKGEVFWLSVNEDRYLSIMCLCTITLIMCDRIAARKFSNLCNVYLESGIMDKMLAGETMFLLAVKIIILLCAWTPFVNMWSVFSAFYKELLICFLRQRLIAYTLDNKNLKSLVVIQW